MEPSSDKSASSYTDLTTVYVNFPVNLLQLSNGAATTYHNKESHTMHADLVNLTNRCHGCGHCIDDRYVLRVSPDMEWHTECLRCAHCGQTMDENCTCFLRDGKAYCKTDYKRLFGKKCDKCMKLFESTDIVMKSRCDTTYHLECFCCGVCDKNLGPGDEYSYRADVGLLCKADHLEMMNSSPLLQGQRSYDMSPLDGDASVDGCDSLVTFSNDEEMKVPGGKQGRPSTRGQKVSGGSGGSGEPSKTTRVRTVLNEKQLHTLRTCYGANPRPDALMKEELTELTGLNYRVVCIWFQNRRRKDKKLSDLSKTVTSSTSSRVKSHKFSSKYSGTAHRNDRTQL